MVRAFEHSVWQVQDSNLPRISPANLQTAAPNPLTSTIEDLRRSSARIPHDENRHIRQNRAPSTRLDVP